MKRRILYVIGTLRRGGAERQLYYLLSRMDRERYQLAVLTMDGAEEDTYVSPLRVLGVEVFVGPTHSSRLGKLWTLIRLVRQLRPELIHCYSFYCNAMSALAALTVGIPCVGSMRSELARQQRRSPYFWKLNAAFPRWQIWISRQALDQARLLGRGYLRSELAVVRIGLDLDAWPATPLPAGPVPVIVAVGSLLPVKRWDRLLAAAANLADHAIPFRLRLAGDGPLRTELEAEVARLNLQSHVELLGDVDDVAALLAGATLLVHTSESEGGPNVVMEAMASGRPVVITDVGDVQYLIRNGISGIIVLNTEGSELADTLRSLLQQPERLAEIGQAARQDAERLFCLDRMVEDTLTVYRRAGWKG